MKNKTKKAFLIGLCCILLFGGVQATAYALTSEKAQKETAEKVKSSASSKETKKIAKDETVYVMTNAEGEMKKVIVSDRIKNSISKAVPSGNDKGKLWDVEGHEFDYSGKIEEELPIDMKISYTLDGKKISFDELKGKSGKLVIRFDYQNHQTQIVEIDGKMEEVAVPFAVLSGLILDNEIFSNIEISNGKVIDDGDHTILAGIAFLGLQENLKINPDKFEIPDYVEIHADVKNFEMSNTLTLVTNEIFNQSDLDELDSINDLENSFNQLRGATNQLLDGSSQLYEGLNTLLVKSNELTEGVNKLADGSGKLKNGTATLKDGAIQLSDGCDQLWQGLNQLSTNNESLNNGAKQVFESLLSMADTQLQEAGISVPKLTIENYAEVLNGLIASLDPDNVAQQAQTVAMQKVKESVHEHRDEIAGQVQEAVKQQVALQVEATVRQNVEGQVLASLGMTKEDYENGITADVIPTEQQNQITAAVDAQMNSSEVQALIETNLQSQMKSQEVFDLIEAKTEEQINLLIDQNMNSPEVQAQITAALKQAESEAASISVLKEQLDSYNSFYLGLTQYTAGVASAKNGAESLNAGALQLKNGSVELAKGADELNSGILTLKNGTTALVEGVQKLNAGAMKLSDGLKEFDEQGIQKLVEAVDGDLGGLLTRIKASVDASKAYQIFSENSKEPIRQVKFIYRTDAIQ